MTFLRHSRHEDDTIKIGAELAALIADASHPVILALHGDLGAGKSVLARSILRYLAKDSALDVPSPTFTIVQEYDPPQLWLPVFHFDLYRLDGPEELLAIGAEDYFADGHCLVEWPEKCSNLLPKDAWHVYIKINKNDPTHRIIKCEELDG